jgi:seryl-tRNA synthetase
MIDPAILRTDPDRIRESQRRRGESVELVDDLVAADVAKRQAQTAFDELRNQQKILGKQIGPLQGALKKATDEAARADAQAELDRLMAQAQDLAEQVKAAERVANEAGERVDALWLQVSNLVNLDSPVGGEEDFAVLDVVGTPRDFAAEGFEPRDHLALGELLGAIDVDRGAKVSGSRFFYLKGDGALLEFALLNLAMQQAVAHGLTPMITPSLVLPSAMEGTGFLGQAAENVYRIEADDMYLVGTSEVPLAGYHSDEIIDADRLPLRYAGWSSCYRREAGSYGKDTRGIIRVHQFDKVEMFSFVEPDTSSDEHDFLLAREEELIGALELPYRVVNIAAGDLGPSASKKYDIEVWLPGQQAYRELTSCSNCTDYQARRLKARVRRDKGTEFVHTLNGTALAIGRTLVAIFENHQNEDGTIRVPEVLHAYGAPKVVGRRGAAVPVS